MRSSSEIYNALETDPLELHHVAPRIRELREALEEAERRVKSMVIRSKRSRSLVTDSDIVRDHVQKLRKTLAKGSLQERKMSLAGVLKAVSVDRELVQIEYRLPLPEDRTFVLSFAW
jgi:hypothetical protein